MVASRARVHVRLLTAAFLLPLLCASLGSAQETAGQRFDLKARASKIDPRAKEHPEINFVFEKDGKPADLQHACVDTRVKPRGELVIWLMGHSQPLAERVSGYGLHYIQVHYANGWFGKLNKEPPPAGQPYDEQRLGKIRLEAAIGQDVSEHIAIPQPDSIAERALQFVLHLQKTNPQGNWQQFVAPGGQSLDWDRVILAGISHGSTTAARFAKHQKVARVVMLSGPRDQYENWQSLASATPGNRYFGFTHVLDGGWTGDHYCRSWELLGLNAYGPVIDVDAVQPPFGNSRRLITNADVKKDAGRAHNASLPGGAAVKDASGKFIHEEVWRYLFTHPVDKVGDAVPPSPDCRQDLRKKAS
jgi:hypothetical protein